jgi:hypothetical protein
MAIFEHKVKMIEYRRELGLLHEDMVALFDERDFTEEQVNKIIRLYDVYRGVIMIDKQTYEMVFRSLIGK